MTGVWVIAEQWQGALERVSLELLAEGRRLATRFGEPLSAVLVGHGVADLAPVLAQHGAETVYLVDDPRLAVYDGGLYTETLAQLAATHNPSTVVCSGTARGREWAPRLAARLRAGYVANYTNFQLDPAGQPIFRRLVYGSRLEATVGCPAGRPRVVVIAPGTVNAERPVPGAPAEVISVEPRLDGVVSRCRSLGVRRSSPRQVELREADVVVGVGMGTGGPPGVGLAEQLADALGGAIGATRPVVDAGWLPPDRQIGLTGRTIAPKLYVASGISGAAYHLMGLREPGFVVAINADRQAPIFKVADVGILGDLFAVIPALLHEVRTGRSALAVPA